MKRIQYASLNQTIHFKLKDGIEQRLAAEEVQSEYENYKRTLERNNIKYRIISENKQTDGSIIIQIKKQVNNYDVGEYLE